MDGLSRQNRGAILAWGQPATQNSAVCVCGRTWQMLTFFTTAKPFQGHSGIIQRNALRSWVRACPDVEVILFGDEEGAAEIAVELGIRHEPHVARNEFGTKRLDAMFARAQEIARHDVLCYVNCDIILPEEFCAALERVRASHVRFLMVGRRWDTNVTQPMDFADVDWGMRVKRLAREQGEQQPGWSVDYFAFPRGMYAEMPELVVGRVWWDHWLPVIPPHAPHDQFRHLRIHPAWEREIIHRPSRLLLALLARQALHTHAPINVRKIHRLGYIRVPASPHHQKSDMGRAYAL